MISRMKKTLLLPIWVALAAIPSAATAHDFFLLPESFHAHQSGSLVVRATVGSTFPNPEILVTPDRVERAWASGEGQPRLHIAGTDDKSLLLHLAGAGSGRIVAAVKAKPRDVDYGEDRIPLILEEYRVGREAVAAVEQLPKPRTWKVVSRRFAKTFACVHTCEGGAEAARPLDGRLEFVVHGSAGEHFQLIGGGRPLADYPVDLVGRDGKRQHLATDAEGVVRLPAGAKGPMMLFAAVLTPPEGTGRFTLDLSSLTFER